MPEIYVTDSQGEESVLKYTPPMNLMELLREAEFDEIAALCGGSCSCATCHLWLNEPDSSNATFAEKDSIETDLLELADDYDEGRSRLSCQLTLLDEHSGLRVTLVKEGF